MWFKLLLISSFGCSTILTTSLYLGGVISGNRMAGVPLGRSLGDGEVDVEGICTESGVACQNCTHSVVCIPLPVGWLKVPLQECLKEQTCNVHLGGCSSTPVPECDVTTQEYQHTCEQVGIFPDAVDCRKFHLCSPPEGSPGGSPADHRVAMCPRNYGYNPRTAQCSIPLNKGQCDSRPVPNCATIGDYGALPSSANHYYVCLRKKGVLYPQIFICPHGWYFWAGFCRPEPQPYDPSTAVSTKNQTESTEMSTKSQTDVTEMSKTSQTDVTEKSTLTHIEQFFSTDKPTTGKPDTFLADKFDLSNYANYDNMFEESPPSDDGLVNSWEMLD